MPSLGTAITMRLSAVRSKLLVMPVGLPLLSTARAAKMRGDAAAAGELTVAAAGDAAADALDTGCAGARLDALRAGAEGVELPQATMAAAAAATAAPRHLSTVTTG
jgi:hypothetical protein